MSLTIIWSSSRAIASAALFILKVERTDSSCDITLAATAIGLRGVGSTAGDVVFSTEVLVGRSLLGVRGGGLKFIKNGFRGNRSNTVRQGMYQQVWHRCRCLFSPQQSCKVLGNENHW